MSKENDAHTELGSADLPLLPPGWCWTTLATIADIDGGITKDQKRRQTPTMREVPYLRVANVQRSYLDLQEMKTILAEDEEIAAMRLLKGDVLFTEGGDRDKLGRGWVWNDEIEECIHQNHIFRARLCLPLVEPKFVSLHGNFFGQQWFTRTGKQTTNLASINKGVLSRFPVPLAPVNEQRRIVDKIEELFSDLDAGVAALERIRANLKRYRAAVLKAAVEGRLTEEWRAKHPNNEPATKLLQRILAERRKKWEEDQLTKFADADKMPPKGWQERYVEPAGPDTSGLPELPKGWCWAALPQLGTLDRGRSRHRPRNAEHLYGGPFPFIQTGDIRHANTFIREYKQTYSEAGLEQSRLWPAGTLCITIAANIAETAILGFDSCFPDSVVGFQADESIASVRYVELYLRTVQARLEELAPATAQKNLNLETLSLVAIACPPKSEQDKIVEEVDCRLSIVDESEMQAQIDLKRAARLRQSIPKRAFEGKLVPQDPTDEPADKLLQRIRQGRTATNGSVAPRTRRGRTAKQAES